MSVDFVIVVLSGLLPYTEAVDARRHPMLVRHRKQLPPTL